MSAAYLLDNVPPQGFPWPRGEGAHHCISRPQALSEAATGNTIQNIEFLDVGCCFVHIEGEEETGAGGSIYNVKEAIACVRVVETLLSGKDLQEEDIVILSPYAAQKHVIETNLQESKFTKVRVANIEEYQGQEIPLVIFSATRSNERNSLGILDDPQRINVAFTRAERGLIVIGNAITLSYGMASNLPFFLASMYFRGLVIDENWEPLSMQS